jgi:hypothetical protein
MEDHGAGQRALVVRDQRNSEILGDQLLAVRTADGAIDLPLRLLCATLGLNRTGQGRRIQRGEELRADFREITFLASKGATPVYGQWGNCRQGFLAPR